MVHGGGGYPSSESVRSPLALGSVCQIIADCQGHMNSCLGYLHTDLVTFQCLALWLHGGQYLARHHERRIAVYGGQIEFVG